MKRVVLYIRVSTDEQIEGFSIKEQKERLIAYCKARGWVIVQIFIDPGWSGSNLSRPGMESMIEFVEEKNCDMVLVYKLDRLSRSQKDTLYLIEDIFLPNQVDFVSVQESFDTSTPFGIAMIGILSVFAQLERSNIAERTMMGRAGRAKDGLWHGGGTDPIGYDYIDGELVINEEEAAQVRMIYELYASGHTLSYIQDQMEGYTTKHGDWHHIGTITSVLDNELYNGTVHFQDVRSPGSHNSVIETSLFEKVQNIRKRNKALKFGDKKSQHMLTGLVFCRSCGGRYFAKKNPNGSYVYCCHSRAKVNKKMVKDPECKNKNWPKHILEEEVERQLFELVRNPESIKKTAISENDGKDTDISHAGEYDAEIMEIEKQINYNMGLYQQDQAPVQVISEKINELYQRKLYLSSLNGKAEKETCYSFSLEHVKMILVDVLHSWNHGSMEYKRSVLKDLINRIDIEGEYVNISWSFK